VRISGANALASGQIGAAQIRGAGLQELYSDIVEMAGIPIGNWMDRVEEQRLLRRQKRRSAPEFAVAFGEKGR
jgi:hypothetical protein